MKKLAAFILLVSAGVVQAQMTPGRMPHTSAAPAPGWGSEPGTFYAGEKITPLAWVGPDITPTMYRDRVSRFEMVDAAFPELMADLQGATSGRAAELYRRAERKARWMNIRERNASDADPAGDQD